jgi:hypothetical protein
MRRRGAWLALALAATPALAAGQDLDEPSAAIRFGVTFARGVPQGEFRDVTDPLIGFSTWLSLPVRRGSPIGIRGEFSVLTLPEQQATFPLPDDDAEISLRGTIGFTGVGPRVEVRAGPLVVTAAAMIGLSRVIADASAVIDSPDGVRSVVITDSDIAVAYRTSADAYLALLRGKTGADVGLMVGVDAASGGRQPFSVRQTLRLEGDQLLVESADVRPSMLVLRAGLSASF